ncbi:hypothetical protein I6M70_17115 [Acinetobacter pittii]|nr:hypothetical protein [Acinetobacter pittii]
MKDRFYMACFRDNVGSNVAWHSVNGGGYTTNIDSAHVYTREEAQSAWELAREFDQPISADHVDKLAVWKVDFQNLPSKTVKDDSTLYAAYKEGRWDGNDLYWVNKYFGLSTDFTRSSRFTKQEAKALLKSEPSYGFIPWDVANEVKRRTFAFNLFHPRKMVQGAGLVTPKRIKLSRKRNPNPKSQLNCPSCGKFVWQMHSYYFEGCKDQSCDYYGKEIH